MMAVQATEAVRIKLSWVIMRSSRPKHRAEPSHLVSGSNCGAWRALGWTNTKLTETAQAHLWGVTRAAHDLAP